ncbi:MAG: hypothetical protein KO463_07625 [Candidatus Methanofastidiosa archaeon]|jgi:phosphoribosylaminoimidazolecarboxamide formyltransferase/IMP cyclohydrolase|nr:hypothetical protein [Candidatus Methanofastidiosa archaeon]
MKALLSAYRHEDVMPWARLFVAHGIELIATQGTMRALEASGIPVESSASLTGFASRLSGGIKTIHPSIHEAMATGEIGYVAVGLMPIDDPTSPGLESMDLGGVLLLRSAVKRHEVCCPLCCPSPHIADVQHVLEGMADHRTVSRVCAVHAMHEVIAYEKATLARLLAMQ